MSKIDLDKPTDANEGGILSRIWRDIVIKNYLINRLDYLVSDYVSKSNNGEAITKKKNKHTIINNICSGSMTWKTFLELIFQVAKFKEIEITVTVKRANGNKTSHTVNIKNNKPTKELEDE